MFFAAAGLLLLGLAGAPSPVRGEYGDVVMNRACDANGVAPVVFSHWFHRIRYGCPVCHGDLGFVPRAGGTEVTMSAIMERRFCGACHDGEAAWSIEHCDLCHTGKAGLATHTQGGTRPRIRKPGGESPGHGAFDEKLPGVSLLQPLSEAREPLPRVRGGDQVDWVAALDRKLIDPRRAKIDGQDPAPPGADVVMWRTGTQGYVRFSHRRHARWVNCAMCHDSVFKPRVAANRNTMARIAMGKSCGYCHGRVAFPLQECDRCHDAP